MGVHTYTVQRWRYGRPRAAYVLLHEGPSVEYAWGVFDAAVEEMEREYRPRAAGSLVPVDQLCGVDFRKDARLWDWEHWPRTRLPERFADGIVPSYVGYPAHAGCGGPIVLGWQAGLEAPAVCVMCGARVDAAAAAAAAAAAGEGIVFRQPRPRAPRPKATADAPMLEQLALPIGGV
jgi:hypothetical protein